MLSNLRRLLGSQSVAAIVMGHSHIMALMAAAQLRLVPGTAKPSGLHVYFFDIWKHEAGYTFTRDVSDAAIKDGLRAAVLDIAARYERSILVTLFGGNVFNVVGMVRHPVPFDCVVPRFPQPADGEAKLLSVSLIEDIMSPWLDLHQRELAAVAGALPFPTFHIESPPIPADGEFCMRTLEQYFRDTFPMGEISPAPLRAKLRAIQSGVYERTCRAVGATFVGAPADATDGEGYLRPEYYGHDGTHGNDRYGELVLRQIEVLSGQRLSWWGLFA